MNDASMRATPKDDYVSYRKAVKENRHAVGYTSTTDSAVDERQLAHSTLYRWITSLSTLSTTLRKTLQIIEEAKPTSWLFRHIVPVDPRKYRSHKRRQCLQGVRQLLRADREYRRLFEVSVFPHLATTCLWL